MTLKRSLSLGAGAICVGVLALPPLLDAGHRRAYRHGEYGQCCPPVNTCCGATGTGYATSSYGTSSYGYGATSQGANYGQGYTQGSPHDQYYGGETVTPPSTAVGQRQPGASGTVPPAPNNQFQDQRQDAAQNNQFQQRSRRPNLESSDREQELQQRIDELQQENEELRQQLDQLRAEDANQTAADQNQPPATPNAEGEPPAIPVPEDSQESPASQDAQPLE